jgi:hypothetical protein
MTAPVVFDVDGTLTSERYDEENLLHIRENPAMTLVAIAMQLERPLVISTARPERLLAQTEEWLAGHGLQPVAIYMRDNDREGVPDHMIKYGHLLDIREKFGEPVVWCDDNDANIHMLKQNGVPVIHVR